MNAKELITAAKSVVEHKNHTGIKDYAFIFAEHILATVREDDDELIDENWLFGLGALSTSASYFNLREYLDDGHTTVQLVKMDGQWNARLVSQYSAVNARLVKTRVQLRKLLDALGVK